MDLQTIWFSLLISELEMNTFLLCLFFSNVYLSFNIIFVEFIHRDVYSCVSPLIAIMSHYITVMLYLFSIHRFRWFVFSVRIILIPVLWDTDVRMSLVYLFLDH